MDDPEPEQLLSVAEKDETDDDVAGNDVQIPEELGQDPRDVGEWALENVDSLDLAERSVQGFKSWGTQFDSHT